jgi:hypothetical protein
MLILQAAGRELRNAGMAVVANAAALPAAASISAVDLFIFVLASRNFRFFLPLCISARGFEREAEKKTIRDVLAPNEQKKTGVNKQRELLITRPRSFFGPCGPCRGLDA